MSPHGPHALKKWWPGNFSNTSGSRLLDARGMDFAPSHVDVVAAESRNLAQLPRNGEV